MAVGIWEGTFTLMVEGLSGVGIVEKNPSVVYLYPQGILSRHSSNMVAHYSRQLIHVTSLVSINGMVDKPSTVWFNSAKDGHYVIYSCMEPRVIRLMKTFPH